MRKIAKMAKIQKIAQVLNLLPLGLATWHRCFTSAFFIWFFVFCFFFVFLFFLLMNNSENSNKIIDVQIYLRGV